MTAENSFQNTTKREVLNDQCNITQHAKLGGNNR